MSRQLAIRGSCDVTLSDFMFPATVGSAAGIVGGIVARMLLDGERSTAKDAAAHVVETGIFLLVGGLTFVLRQRRQH